MASRDIFCVSTHDRHAVQNCMRLSEPGFDLVEHSCFMASHQRIWWKLMRFAIESHTSVQYMWFRFGNKLVFEVTLEMGQRDSEMSTLLETFLSPTKSWNGMWLSIPIMNGTLQAVISLFRFKKLSSIHALRCFLKCVFEMWVILHMTESHRALWMPEQMKK